MGPGLSSPRILLEPMLNLGLDLSGPMIDLALDLTGPILDLPSVHQGSFSIHVGSSLSSPKILLNSCWTWPWILLDTHVGPFLSSPRILLDPHWTFPWFTKDSPGSHVEPVLESFWIPWFNKDPSGCMLDLTLVPQASFWTHVGPGCGSFWNPHWTWPWILLEPCAGRGLGSPRILPAPW